MPVKLNNINQQLPFVPHSPKKWFVIFTKPKHEIKVAERLTLMGIDNYCPTVVKWSKWSDRIKKLIVPALPSMVLVNLEDKNRNKVFDCPGVSRYLFFDKKIAIVPQSDIDSLRIFLQRDGIGDVFINKPNVGDFIKVESFKNELGQVSKISSNRVWVKLNSLNLIVSLKV
jgi:transcriptional antiterminator RfaH